MGARTVFTFETEPGEAIHLYSHWGGDTKLEDLAEAMAFAEPRWDDEAYGLRIMISRLIGESWNSEYSYGLWTQHRFEEEYEPLSVHIRHKLVIVGDVTYDFDEFVSKFAGSKKEDAK
jgi:hypothetical protein